MKMADALIGTWRVVGVADLDKDGKWQYRFGEHPRGYFVYDVTGHVHIQIMKVPPLPPFPEAKLTDGTPLMVLFPVCGPQIGNAFMISVQRFLSCRRAQFLRISPPDRGAARL